MKMVRLTVDLIARGTSGYTKKKRDESIQHYLKRLTHLYLEDRGIDEIGDDLGLCRNLMVLYLYDNKLLHVPNLNHNGNLTHLYLQNNHLSKMEGLHGLRKLTKLYIGGNSITVIENLEKLDQLQELHVENQHLPSGEKLLFDPRTIGSLVYSLQVLNVSGNNLDSLSELQPLQNITQFMANDNNLSDMKEFGHCLGVWRNLWRLELMGNPVCHKTKYRDRIIIMGPRLEVLDGKEISETAKQFLRNWQANRDAVKRKRESNTQQARRTSALEGGDRELSAAMLGSAAARLGNDVPGYIMPALPRKQFSEVLARSVSQPGSADALSHTLRTTYSDLSPPKSSEPLHTAPFMEKYEDQRVARYLNTLGTTYHSGPSQAPASTHKLALLTMGSDFSSGDKPLAPLSRTK